MVRSLQIGDGGEHATTSLSGDVKAPSGTAAGRSAVAGAMDAPTDWAATVSSAPPGPFSEV